MEYILPLIVVLGLIVPIILPLVYYYLLRNRTSKIYTICKNIRRIFSVLIVFVIFINFYKETQKEHINIAGFIGSAFGQSLIAFLLWKTWKKDEVVAEQEQINQPNS